MTTLATIPASAGITSDDLAQARKEQGWTDLRTRLAKAMWMAGMSASQISVQIHGASRNAVIGIIHRSGLSGRDGQTRKTASAPRKVGAPVSLKLKAPAVGGVMNPLGSKATRHGVAGNGMVFDRGEDRPPREAVAPRDEPKGTATLLHLTACSCKWPIGDPRDESFSFCGRRTAAGRPYCPAHAQVAYQPANSANGKRRPTANELARSLRKHIS